jgi:hypothetical protein
VAKNSVIARTNGWLDVPESFSVFAVGVGAFIVWFNIK